METVTGWDSEVARALDLAGVFAFAVSGGLLAVRKHYDVVGLVVLALVTSLGGGTLRDVLLGDLPPLALSSTDYLVVPVLAAGLVFVAHDVIERRLRTSVLVFDAAGLGLFCVTGALRALDLGAPAVAAVLLGAITATGGGVIRDTLAGEHPMIFRADSVLYSVPATFGALAIVLVSRTSLPLSVASVVVAIVVFVWRVTAVRRGWRAPRPRRTSGAR